MFFFTSAPALVGLLNWSMVSLREIISVSLSYTVRGAMVGLGRCVDFVARLFDRLKTWKMTRIMFGFAAGYVQQ